MSKVKTLFDLNEVDQVVRYFPESPFVIESKSLSQLVFRNPKKVQHIMKKASKNSKVRNHIEWLICKGDQKVPVVSCQECNLPAKRFSVLNSSYRDKQFICNKSECEDEVKKKCGGHSAYLTFFSLNFNSLIKGSYCSLGKRELKKVANTFCKAFGLPRSLDKSPLTKRKAFNFFKN